MWSDRETLEDCLGFSSYVESLAEVCLEPDIAPLTIGIFGSWGSGKTSLMQMLRRRIDEQPSKDGAKVVTLWFNAWRYEGREEIQSALIHSILGRLAQDVTLTDDIKNTLGRLKDGASVLKLATVITKSAITLTPDFGGLLACFKDEAAKVVETMEGFEKDFEKLLTQVHVSRLVVFVDDLDRCSSEKVVEAFETIKLFLNTPATTFVVGADAPKIEQAIGTVYQVAEAARPTYARDYLEKIVQLPFSIPEQRSRDVAAYVGMLTLQRHVTTEGWKELIVARRALLQEAGSVQELFVQWIGQHDALLQPKASVAAQDDLGRTMSNIDVLAHGLRGNPRQLKRFLNILDLRQRIAKTNALIIRPDLLTKLAVLEYTWRDFFNQVTETISPDGRSELIGAVITYAAGDALPPDTSAMLTAALATPGLSAFLSAPPHLDGDTDLTPYLFLAQTALDPQRQTLIPQAQIARDLAERMASDDSIRSRSASLQAAQLDAPTASAVVRLVATRILAMQGPTEKRARVNALQALESLCKATPEHYRIVTDTLRTADVVDEGFAIGALRVLTAAAKSGVLEAQDVASKYSARSPMAKALSSPKGSAAGKPRQP
jgi:hypothetical protein